MQGQKYKDIRRDRIIEIKNVDGNIAQLNNDDRVSIERLMDTKYYQPLSTNNSRNTINNSQVMNESVIQNQNTNMGGNDIYKNLLKNKSYSIGDDGDGDEQYMERLGTTRYNPSSEVKMSGVVESHSQNIRGLGGDVDDNTPVTRPFNPNNRQNNGDTDRRDVVQQAPKNLSPEEELLMKYGHEAPTQNNKDAGLEKYVYTEEEKERLQKNSNVNNSRPITEPPSVNPIHQMFEKAKRVKQLNVSFKINEKIPNKDVIKMLEENFEDSAIDYYAEEIFNKLMSDPSIIKDQVKEAITKYINSRK